MQNNENSIYSVEYDWVESMLQKADLRYLNDEMELRELLENFSKTHFIQRRK